MKKVLVIGASGFLGSNIVGELLNSNIVVYAVEHHVRLQDNPGQNVIKGGIRAVNRNLIRSVKPDMIFHLARPRFPKLRKPGRMLAANWAAIQNQHLVNEIEKSGHPVKLIFASGSLMYGPSFLPSDEDTPLKPFSFAKQYYPGEIPVLDAMHEKKIPVTVVRFPWLLGKGSWFEWFYLPNMRQNKAVPLFGDGTNLMEIIDIRDAAKLFIKFAGNSSTTGIINMVSSGAIPQFSFANMISAISGFPVKDYNEIAPGRIEKEALESFTSTIVLSTKYPELTAGFRYTPLEETVKRIITT